jgi:hypothetical protein
MNKQTRKTTKTTKTTKTKTPQSRQAVNKTETRPAKRTFDPAIRAMINPNAAGIDVASEMVIVIFGQVFKIPLTKKEEKK